MDKGSRKFHPAAKSYTQAKYHSMCAHCERQMNNFAGGYSRGYNNELLCRPNAANRPDCYTLVTRYRHPTPCDSNTCYEDHNELMIYVKARENDAEKPNTESGSLETLDRLCLVRDN